ncbi:probable arsenite oxidase small subunit precursor [Aeropyrum pernix K1]|uniref:Probable arsenite oxidase small subunit n=1 Tax=Aeropyrum pernix (strain ATCC 700893 / DSM 11879 / JCM 9820 / NBRC 100138 / K1) TaxID=272557 RepID=Q9Y8S0_AERPE|nr:arsenate reductase (azurin) small subunit [Aeropyrum pernix]BAA81580.1 probable arsenite oxidase small subunit precursor [Aeropyrum pernix K1]
MSRSDNGGEDKGLRITRREFLAAAGAGAAAFIVGAVVGSTAFPREKEVVKPGPTQTVTATATETATVTETQTQVQLVEKKYPKVKIANVSELREGQPVFKEYIGHRIVVIKLGEEAVNGVGPDKDIVAFSMLCTHMGGFLIFDGNTKTLICPLHFSQFDPSRGGQPVVGHATEYLPQVILEYDEASGDIFAVGFTALVYGRYDNLQGVKA